LDGVTAVDGVSDVEGGTVPEASQKRSFEESRSSCRRNRKEADIFLMQYS
jgi:hypothetical protein